MLKLHSQKQIKFFTVEKATVWLVFACVVETQGDQIVYVSAPRLVKVNQKHINALPGKKQASTPFLLTGNVPSPKVESSIVSPYFSQENIAEPEILVWYNARPPTYA